MKVTVRYFASLREALGASEALEQPAGTTLADLRDALVARSPAHASVLGRERTVRCALDQVMSAEQAVLHDGAEVAFFPPVTGG